MAEEEKATPGDGWREKSEERGDTDRTKREEKENKEGEHDRGPRRASAAGGKTGAPRSGRPSPGCTAHDSLGAPDRKEAGRGQPGGGKVEAVGGTDQPGAARSVPRSDTLAAADNNRPGRQRSRQGAGRAETRRRRRRAPAGDTTRHAGWTKPAVITTPPVNAEWERPLCGATGERHTDPKGRKKQQAVQGKRRQRQERQERQEGQERQARQERRERRGRRGEAGEGRRSTAAGAAERQAREESRKLGADSEAARGTETRARGLASARSIRRVVLRRDVHIAHV